MAILTGGTLVKKNVISICLGIYDLILSAGAIFYGILMIGSVGGFSVYPKEWTAVLPFRGWTEIGIIAAGFGLGNIISAIYCFKKGTAVSGQLSVVMGILLSAGMVMQVIVLGEWYLATAEFLAAGILQMILGVLASLKNQDKQPDLKFAGK
jgi:hypothetical protein